MPILKVGKRTPSSDLWIPISTPFVIPSCRFSESVSNFDTAYRRLAKTFS